MRRKFIPTFLLSLIYCLSINLKANTLYDMNDLENLKNNHNYQEFLTHALDIRPKLRDETWKKIVSEMAIEYIIDRKKHSAFTKEDLNRLQRLTNFNFLKNDHIFSLRKSQYMLKWLRNCYIKTTQDKKLNCYNALVQYWSDSPKYDAIGVSLATLVAQHHPDIASYDLYRYIKFIPLSKTSYVFCRKKIVKDILLLHLDQKLTKLENDPKSAPQLISKEMNQDCWTEMIAFLKEKLFSPNHQDKTIAFRLLKAKSKLTSKEEDLFYTLYILQGPIIGQLFNSAWLKLESLGQSFKRRKSVLEVLKSYEPLPGYIFSSPNVLKRKTIINLFSQNFPEYLKYYSDTCLKYLEGKVSYPLGNPTIECRDLFNTDKNNKWIPSNKHQRFNKTTHF